MSGTRNYGNLRILFQFHGQCHAVSHHTGGAEVVPVAELDGVPVFDAEKTARRRETDARSYEMTRKS